ncbi:high affinity cAMP-specific and IBMX-insensitive 3',5'-cyclic phosphodiesterase 8A-like isoform X2 [Dermatophagoides farinae]
MEHLSPTSSANFSNTNNSLIVTNMATKNNRRSRDYMDDEMDGQQPQQSSIIASSLPVSIQCKLCSQESMSGHRNDHNSAIINQTNSNEQKQIKNVENICDQQHKNQMKKKIKRSDQIIDKSCQQQKKKMDNDDDEHYHHHYCCRHQKRIINPKSSSGANNHCHQPYCCLYGSSSSSSMFNRINSTTSATIARLEPYRDQPPLLPPSSSSPTQSKSTQSYNLLGQCSLSDQSLSAVQTMNTNNNISSSSSSSGKYVSQINELSGSTQMLRMAMNINSNNNKQQQQQQQQQQSTITTNTMVEQLHQPFIQFGRMNIEMKNPKLLLVFNDKYDNHAKWLCDAGKKSGFTIIDLVDTKESAMNLYVEKQHELIIIDSRSHVYNHQHHHYHDHHQQQQQQRHVRFDSNNSARTKFLLQDSSSSHPPASSSSSSSTTLLFCDNRQQQPTLDSLNLCRAIRDIKGSEFTIVMALMNKNFYDNNEKPDDESYYHHHHMMMMMDIYKSGFNRCISETVSQGCGYYQNELIQLCVFELPMQMKLRAAQTMMMAIDSCKDGVVITGPSHDIRYVNQSIEKMFGFRAEDMIGQRTQDFFQNDLIKMDVDEKINNYNDGKEWEGQIYHRRKSGESVPIWNRIMPINYRKGVPEYIIYIKEFPFLFVDKLMSPEREFSSSHGSLATSSSPNTAAAARNAYRKMSTIDVRSEARRPSLAKFNSVSMIEAPITKVINILMAIKESGPTFLAPTLEKAIDILKNSEVFNKFQNQINPDDQVTSELVSSLMNTSNKSTNSSTRRLSHDVPSHKNSVSYHLTQTMSTPTYSSQQQSHHHSQQQQYQHQSSLSSSITVPANIQKLLDNDLEWNFDVIELERISDKCPLLWLGTSIFDRFNVLQTLNCSQTVARNWLSLIEANYRKNSYHNSTHAADVMQATAYYLMSERLKTLFDPFDQAICLIAAIIHDVDHPGRNSAFLSNSNHELAVLYNDISVLESHHAAYGFRLTVLGPDSDRVNIFKNLDRETYRECRQSIIDMVLATEMTKHFEHLTKFVRTFQSFNIVDDEQLISLDKYKSVGGGSGNKNDDDNISTSTTVSDLATPENIVLIKRMLIKCADVSNPGRPTKLCEVWANRIASEYCDQTEEEKRKCLPVVMPTFDRRNCSIPKSQIGFIDYFANDMFEAWHSFGNFTEMIDNMNINYQYWKDKLSASAESKSRKVSESAEDDIKEVDEENTNDTS